MYSDTLSGVLGVREVGSIELKAAVDVKKGGRVRLSDLFTLEERKRTFTSKVDVPTGASIKVNVAKFEAFETIADLGSRRGEACSLWRILKIWDLDRELTASSDVKKGEALKVSVEAL
ncbi:MAG: hypothetical protein N3H31_04755 [Candidatus Nezhaarchaeota archaeon]|nr:hypothetical protein [Candidatus Nezhaarchaeota archaeon]